jgi:outer membrane protein TolC
MLEEVSRAVLRRVQGELARKAELHERARSDADAWRLRVLPDVEEASRLAEKAFAAGRFSELQALDRLRALVDARLALVGMDLERERSRAEVENAAGPAE